MAISLEWLAGFVDGEGYIGLAYRSTKNRATKEKTLYPRLTITNTYLPVLLKIKEEFGGSLKIQSKSKQYNKNGRQSYSLAWGPKATRLLLERLLPFLIVKKEQADLLLLHWKPLPFGTKIDAAEHSHREWINAKLQELKRIEYFKEEVH